MDDHQKCPDHEMIKSQGEGSCNAISKIWDELEKKKDGDTNYRTGCVRQINEKFDNRPTTGTLLTIAGIFFGVIIAVIITLSTVQGGKIEDLQKTDSRISKIQEETTKELREIKESLIRLETIVKK